MFKLTAAAWTAQVSLRPLIRWQLLIIKYIFSCVFLVLTKTLYSKWILMDALMTFLYRPELHIFIFINILQGDTFLRLPKSNLELRFKIQRRGFICEGGSERTPFSSDEDLPHNNESLCFLI